MNSNELDKCISLLNSAIIWTLISIIPFFLYSSTSEDTYILIALFLLLLIPILLSPFLTGKHKLFRIDITTNLIRLSLYVWAFIVLIFISVIVYKSGGVKGSPAIWIYKLAIITALLLSSYRKKDVSGQKKGFFSANRVVIFVFVLCVISTFLVGYDGCQTIMTKDIIYSLMVCYTLFISIILFYMADEFWTT